MLRKIGDLVVGVTAVNIAAVVLLGGEILIFDL